MNPFSKLIRASGLLLLFLLMGSSAQSQTNQPTPEKERIPVRPKRWLIVVEASKPMRLKKEGMMQVAQKLLQSEMNKQLVPGDSLGVWTFNRELSTGKLPLQKWSLATRNETSINILTFIEGQSYEQTPNPSVLGPALVGIAERSELLTVILLTSGEGQITGTPFDSQINEGWTKWAGEKSKKPIITVLRALEGAFTQQRVTPGDYPITFPPLPQVAAAESKQLATNALVRTNVAPVTRPAGTSGPVLIFSGPNKPYSQELTNRGMASSNLIVVGPAAATGRVASVHAETSNLVISTPPNTRTPVVGEEALSTEFKTSAVPVSAGPVVATAQPVSADSKGIYITIACVAGGVFLVGIIVGVLIVRARGRARTESSLITESIDEDR